MVCRIANRSKNGGVDFADGENLPVRTHKERHKDLIRLFGHHDED